MPEFFESIGPQLGLTGANLPDIVIRFVSYALGFLPLVGVVMLVIGGLQWMTSGGNEERVMAAKKTISAAVIGMVIILLAWAIVTFVISTTSKVAE